MEHDRITTSANAFGEFQWMNNIEWFRNFQLVNLLSLLSVDNNNVQGLWMMIILFTNDHHRPHTKWQWMFLATHGVRQGFLFLPCDPTKKPLSQILRFPISNDNVSMRSITYTSACCLLLLSFFSLNLNFMQMISSFIVTIVLMPSN